MFVRNGTEMAPISQFVTLKRVLGPEVANRFNLFSCITVNVNPAPGYSTGEVQQAIEEVAAQMLPTGYGYEYGGMAREEANTGGCLLYTSYATMKVSTADKELTTPYSATIRGRQDIDIYPQVSGTIERLCVTEGQVVRKGQLLFVIEMCIRDSLHRPAFFRNIPRSLIAQTGGSMQAFPIKTECKIVRNQRII